MPSWQIGDVEVAVVGAAGVVVDRDRGGDVVEAERARDRRVCRWLPKLDDRVPGGVELLDVAGAVVGADVEDVDVAGGVVDRDAGRVREGAEGAYERVRGRRQRRVGARLEGARRSRGADPGPGDVEVGGVLDRRCAGAVERLGREEVDRAVAAARRRRRRRPRRRRSLRRRRPCSSGRGRCWPPGRRSRCCRSPPVPVETRVRVARRRRSTSAR